MEPNNRVRDIFEALERAKGNAAPENGAQFHALGVKMTKQDAEKVVEFIDKVNVLFNEFASTHKIPTPALAIGLREYGDFRMKKFVIDELFPQIICPKCPKKDECENKGACNGGK